MMNSQIKAEFFKLRYSNIFKAIPILFGVGMILYVIFSLSGGGTQLLISEGDEEVNTTIHGMIGFLAFTFEDLNKPQFEEILKSAMSGNVFLWIFVLVLVVQFFNYDYNLGTIKLPIAYGVGRIKIFLAKFLLIIIYSGVFYLLFSTVTFIYTCIYASYSPNSSEVLKYLEYTGLNYLVMISYILLCLIASICLKNIGIISTVMCLYTLGGAIIYTGVWQQFHSYSILRYFIQLNPLYYWMNMGTLRLDYGIINEMMIYFLFGMFILLPISIALIRKQEFK